MSGEHLSALGPSLKRDERLRTWARRYARLVLERRHGNKRETARVLGISYHTLQAYLRVPVDGGAAGDAVGDRGANEQIGVGGAA